MLTLKMLHCFKDWLTLNMLNCFKDWLTLNMLNCLKDWLTLNMLNCFKDWLTLNMLNCFKYWLTLNMLNCFKDCNRYIHILKHILDLAWPELMELTLEQQYMLSVLPSQYHACWCSGDFRSQGINRHGTCIDPKSWNIPSSASEELIFIMKYTVRPLI